MADSSPRIRNGIGVLNLGGDNAGDRDAEMHRPVPAKLPSLEWEDCTGMYNAEARVFPGDAVWPSMIEVEWPEAGTIIADDARSMARLLNLMADACDLSTAETRRGS